MYHKTPPAPALNRHGLSSLQESGHRRNNCKTSPLLKALGRYTLSALLCGVESDEPSVLSDMPSESEARTIVLDELGEVSVSPTPKAMKRVDAKKLNVDEDRFEALQSLSWITP